MSMKLAPIFTDGMVIQRNKVIRVFGTGDGEVSVTFCGKTSRSVSRDGKWLVLISSEEAGGPYEMTVRMNDETVILRDVMVGEVWMISGQSNAEHQLFGVDGGFAEAKEENPMVRLFQVPTRLKADRAEHHFLLTAACQVDTPWRYCTEEHALRFSAIGVLFAKMLQKKLGCAVGMIACHWGSRYIEAFMNRDDAEQEPAFADSVEMYRKKLEKFDNEAEYSAYMETMKPLVLEMGDTVPDFRRMGAAGGTAYTMSRYFALAPSLKVPKGIYGGDMLGIVWESMVSRVVPYTMAGVLWYQGESNSPEGYADKYGAMMASWRKAFDEPNLQFYAVELAPLVMTDRTRLPKMRQQQRAATVLYDHNYLATSAELGDTCDIHPPRKKEFAYRLYLLALKYRYGLPVLADAPRLKVAELRDGKVYLSFYHDRGLFAYAFREFAVYDVNGKEYPANVKFLPETKELEVTCNELNAIAEVSYGYMPYYYGHTVYNEAGLPLEPFRCYVQRPEKTEK